MGVLEAILANKREELAALRTRKLPKPPPIPEVFGPRGADEPLHLICEIKPRSPSAGTLSSALTVTERAQAYEGGGASMVSVLTDQQFFGGSFESLQLARQGTKLPLLCKEFVIDPVQLDAARAFGASAVLLIVRCVSPKELYGLTEGARARGLVPIVEIQKLEELQQALDAGATHIGVNARDLDTLVMNHDLAAEVAAKLPSGVVRAHFSGVKTALDITRLRASGLDAALVGEVLMRLDDPLSKLHELHAAATGLTPT